MKNDRGTVTEPNHLDVLLKIDWVPVSIGKGEDIEEVFVGHNMTPGPNFGRWRTSEKLE